MKTSLKLALTAIMAVAVSACTTTKPVDTSAADEAARIAAEQRTAEAEALARRQAAEAAERERKQQLLANTVIYFEFNGDSVSAEYSELLQVHAEYIQATGKSIILEGHADERGTPEYNLALGERRAKSVEQLLRTHGVSMRQVEVVSFGEESPANPTHSESAWQVNRRVEIKYQ